MKYSIVIPAFKRSDILERTLYSVYNQTLMPYEVILVDNNINNLESSKLIKLLTKFSKKNFTINLIKSTKNSGAVARNIGAKYSKGDIVAFLDSDVILDPNYYYEISKYFKKFDDLVAIQGVDKSLIESQLELKNLDFFSKIFYKIEQFFETSLLFNKNNSFVSPSLAVAHPSVIEDFEINSQWISTCAGLFKRDLFEKYSFPNQFITYSNNEYLFFSYSIFKGKEGKMIYTSKAKYRDIQTSSGRLKSKTLMYQIQVYDLYIFIKLFRIKPINILIFFKSRIGHLLLNLYKTFKKKRFSLIDYFYSIDSIFYPFRNLKLILKEDLSFYEKDFPINEYSNYVDD